MAGGGYDRGMEKALRLALALLAAAAAAGCGGDVYLRDGVTDGDTFYLSQQALVDDDPALQSWVSYSLTRSACQLAIGGPNPARASSFDCELTARRHLLETWREQGGQDAYLDELAAIAAAGWLPEYVARHYARDHWTLPPDLDAAGLRRFLRSEMPGHRPQTRLVGSWNYARLVGPRN